MESGDQISVPELALTFTDTIYKYTDYENREDGETTFKMIKVALPHACKSKDGSKLIQKFLMLGKTVSTEGSFQDMVKIIWRMVKPMSASPMNKICLFIISIASVAVSLRTGPNAGNVEGWLGNISTWLGKQLTIGGKGCTGEGEGSAKDRIQRFFSTPYLHDFD